jgi:RNA polymerase sigma-70 factor (ECF subfamily)
MAAKKKSLVAKKRVVKKPTQKVSKKIISQLLSFRRKADFPWNSSSVHALLVVRPIIESTSKSYRQKSSWVRCEELSDGELTTVIRTQNIEAYKELFFRYQKKLFAYIFHLVGSRDDAEDILQNVFSKTYKNIGNFDTSRKFSSWIYRIAHNEAVNFIKHKSKRYTVSWDDVTTNKDKLDMATNDEPQEDRWLREETTKEITEAIEKLPKRYQQILQLRYFQEYSYNDISKMLDRPINTIGTLINRAKRKLLEIVKQQRIKK